MNIEEPEQPCKPQLQFEYAGSGPGGRGKTAVGFGDFGQPLDRSELPEIPWWFAPFVESNRKNYEKEFSGMSTLEALSFLESAGIPPIYRLGLGARWQFCDWQSHHFSIDDFSQILIAHPECEMGVDIKHAMRVLGKIEASATYRIWRKYGRSVLSKEDRARNAFQASLAESD